MPTFDFEGKSVHFERDGSGRPILILNGIMMSTKSWAPFLPTLSEHFEVIRLDFLDQGQSDKLIGQSYTQQIQVKVIDALLKELHLSQIDIAGISYGGEVALQFASQYPVKVRRLILFNTCAYTNEWLKSIGDSWIATGKTRNGQHYYNTTIPVIYSPHFYEQKIEWMKQRERVLIPLFSNELFLDQMERLTKSAESFDVRDDLHKITAPTLIISAEEDYLTPIANQEYLHQHISKSSLVKLPLAGHASMYEQPALFTTFLVGFFGIKDIEYSI